MMKPARASIGVMLTLVLAQVAAIPAPAAGAVDVGAARQIAQQVIVAPAENADWPAVIGTLHAHGYGITRRLYGDRAALVDVPVGRGAREVATLLGSLPGVAYAEPDSGVSALFAPNDPLYADGSQWAPGRIKAASAWDVSWGSGVLVAIVDTGIDLDHEDLAAHLWVNDDEVPANGIDDDGNGFVDDIHGWDFVNDDGDPADDNGHGSHCAGIAGAVTDNAVGIAGVAGAATLLPVKVLDSGGRGSSAALAEGIDYAVDNGARVVSVSIGGSVPNTTLALSIQRAWNAGVTVVAAAGNDGGAVLYPAAQSEALCVGATDEGDVRTVYSNYGAAMDVVAPGGTSGTPILSTLRNDTYGLKYGTSMATPHVAGAIALLLEHRELLSPASVAYLLETAALDRGTAGWDPYYGYGLVQTRSALDLMLGDITAPTSACATAPAPPEGVEVAIKPSDVGLGVDRVEWWLDTGVSGTGDRVEVTAPGHRTFSYRTVDLAGNAEPTQSVSFEVTDTLPPVTTSDAIPEYFGGSATITLEANDRGIGVAETRWVLDGEAARTGTSVEVASTGDHTLSFASTDLLGHVEPTHTVTFRVWGSATVARLSGDDRYATALAISRACYAAGSSPAAVIASGEDFPDALAASGLAGALHAPVLLVRRTGLPAGVLDELARLGTTAVTLVGGPAAISDEVVGRLAAAGFAVRRVGGDDRYSTAARVATAIERLTGSSPAHAFVVRGDSFADALAVAPVAYRHAWPVLLARTDQLTPVTVGALAEADGPDVIIAGGEAAISAAVATEIAERTGEAPLRIGGETRYETAELVAAHALTSGWLGGSYLGVATGVDYPDALAGGAAAGAHDGTVVLTLASELSIEARRVVEAHAHAGWAIDVYGGPVAVAPVVLTRLRQIPLI